MTHYKAPKDYLFIGLFIHITVAYRTCDRITVNDELERMETEMAVSNFN